MLKIYAVPVGNCDRHIAARKLLKSVYVNLTGDAMPEICKDENGKPHFADDSLHFSLSYTADYCFCAVSHVPVGLDAEACREVKPALLQGVLSAAEQDVVTSAEDLHAEFMRFWTLKESYVKYTGQGIANTRLRETEFDVSGDTPVLRSDRDLRFYNTEVDLDGSRVLLSVCTTDESKPQLYLDGEEYDQF